MMVRLGLAVLLVLSACTTRIKETTTFHYPRCPEHRPVARNVRVVPFVDHRETKDRRGAVLAYIPFIPYGDSVYGQPERWPRTHFRPRQDVPKVLAKGLGKARIFTTVTDATEMDSPLEGADLVLEGALRSSRMERRIYTYGLSFLAAPLWLLGAPVQRIALVLDVYARIVDVETGDVLWDVSWEERWQGYRSVLYRQASPKLQEMAARAAHGIILEMDRAAAMGRFD
jgi:hypothetical protein